METTTFVIQSDKTGEVVHVHVEPTSLRSTDEEILQHASGSRTKRTDLRVVRLEADQPLAASTKGKAAKPPSGEPTPSSAGGGLADGASEPEIERRYEHRPRGD